MNKFEELAKKLEDLKDEAKKNHVSLVATLATYDAVGARFSTALSLFTSPEAEVTEDHTFLDCQREQLAAWHNANHETRVQFVQPPPPRTASEAWFLGRDLDHVFGHKLATQEEICVEGEPKRIDKK